MVDRLLLTTPLNRFQCKGQLMSSFGFLTACSRQPQFDSTSQRLRVNLSVSQFPLLHIADIFLRFTTGCFILILNYLKTRGHVFKCDLFLLSLLQAQQISAWCQSAPPAWGHPARTTAPVSQTPLGPTTAPAHTASGWVSQKVFRVNQRETQIYKTISNPQRLKSHFLMYSTVRSTQNKS